MYNVVVRVVSKLISKPQSCTGNYLSTTLYSPDSVCCLVTIKVYFLRGLESVPMQSRVLLFLVLILPSVLKKSRVVVRAGSQLILGS